MKIIFPFSLPLIFYCDIINMSNIMKRGNIYERRQKQYKQEQDL